MTGLKKAGIILVVAVCIAVFFGCTPETQEDSGGLSKTTTIETVEDNDMPGTFEGLSAELELKIRQDYLDAYVKPFVPDALIDSVLMTGYYGTYNGCVAVIIHDLNSGVPGVDLIYVIAGIEFVYPGHRPIVIWKDGFYNFKAAYDLNFLTQEDVRSISELYKEKGVLGIDFTTGQLMQ